MYKRLFSAFITLLLLLAIFFILYKFYNRWYRNTPYPIPEPLKN